MENKDFYAQFLGFQPSWWMTEVSGAPDPRPVAVRVNCAIALHPALPQGRGKSEGNRIGRGE
jgi:hypothetical protein